MANRNFASTDGTDRQSDRDNLHPDFLDGSHGCHHGVHRAAFRQARQEGKETPAGRGRAGRVQEGDAGRPAGDLARPHHADVLLLHGAGAYAGLHGGKHVAYVLFVQENLGGNGAVKHIYEQFMTLPVVQMQQENQRKEQTQESQDHESQ